MNKCFVSVINNFCIINTMKEYNNNSNPSWKKVDVYKLTAKETVGNIQNISKNIRNYSLKMRETMKTLR